MAHQCAAISGADTNTKAVVEFCSTTADLSVPNLRSKGAHASPSLLAHAAGRGWGPAKTPRAASCLLMGSRPQWPPFGAKPRSCKYSYGVSPGFPPGSFYPPPRSAAAQGTMIRCILLYVQNTTPGSNCQYLFPSLPLFRNRPPKNPHREAPLRRQVPEGGGCGCGPAPGRKEIKNMKKRSILYGVPHPWGDSPPLLGLAAP